MPAGSTASASYSPPRGTAPQRRSSRWSISRLPRPHLSAQQRVKGRGMSEVSITVRNERPLILRIVDFPLVAMAVAVLLFAFATALGLWLGKLVPPIGQPGTAAVHMGTNIAPALATS